MTFSSLVSLLILLVTGNCLVSLLILLVTVISFLGIVVFCRVLLNRLLLKLEPEFIKGHLTKFFFTNSVPKVSHQLWIVTIASRTLSW